MRKLNIHTYSYYKLLRDISNLADGTTTKQYYFSEKDFIFYDVFIYIHRQNEPFKLTLNLCYKENGKRNSFSTTFIQKSQDIDKYLDIDSIMFDGEIQTIYEWFDYLRTRYSDLSVAYNDLVDKDYTLFRTLS